MEEQAGGAEDHDEDFRGLHDPDDLRLVVGIGELAGERREQEEGRDEQPTRNGAERRLLLGIAVDAVDHQHHHRGAEQIVVERPQELGDEDRQEPPGPHQVKRVVHQSARA